MGRVMLTYPWYFGTEVCREFDAHQLAMAYIYKKNLREKYDAGQVTITPLPTIHTDKFVEVNGTACPNCTRNTIRSTGVVQVNEDGTWQGVECYSCKSAWKNEYILIGYHSLEIP